MTAPLSHLPGGELIGKGLADLLAGRLSAESCLIAIGWSRLKRGGLMLPDRPPSSLAEPEHLLYRLLGAEQRGDAYSRYNALIRRLISFEQALEHSATSHTDHHP